MRLDISWGVCFSSGGGWAHFLAILKTFFTIFSGWASLVTLAGTRIFAGAGANVYTSLHIFLVAIGLIRQALAILLTIILTGWVCDVSARA